MPETKRQWLRLLGGWALVISGVAGCVLPIAPGIPLIIAGLALLSTEYVWARKASDRLKKFVANLKKKWRDYRTNSAT